MTMLVNPYAFATGGGGELPPGATANLDFVNGFYYAGGAERNVGDVLTGHDEAEISASGMYFIFSNANRPKAAGALLTDFIAALTAGCTIVFDFDFVNTPFGYAMFIGDNTDFETSVDGISISTADQMFDANSLALGANFSSTGVHKLAVTLNRDVGGGNYEYAWSLDGAAASTQTVAYAASWLVDVVALGWDGSGTDELLDAVYLREVTLYPAMVPGDLPALTFLGT